MNLITTFTKTVLCTLLIGTALCQHPVDKEIAQYAQAHPIGYINGESLNQQHGSLYMAYRNLWDFFYEGFGNNGVAPELEALVRSVQSELNLEGLTIEVRAMNSATRALFTAFASLNLIQTSHAPAHVISLNGILFNDHILLIDEAWVNAISYDEQRILIGTQLQKIDQAIFLKEVLLDFTMYYGTYLLASKFKPETPAIAPAIFSKLLASWYGRTARKNAEITVAQKLNCAQAGQQLWDRIIQEQQIPESRFMLKRFARSALRGILWPFNKAFRLFDNDQLPREKYDMYAKLAAQA